ncbi:hypothetical protein TSOC_004975 [Tetrabaena socialis]|uniref:Uncharacterized protein n=1 Tax=Tetrabaena socialis TaxID=47790 RepID=A0A2J8A7F4_9CHLO|nr:hypothetical protein TSOC_004975 [Tetrabaena socialis]|eukprot:PNH08448.1 hypothetical protein TSOC_004975 [Tetrabaena socialis]
MTLRSPWTERRYELSLLLAGPWDNPHRRRYPGRLSGVLALEGADTQRLEFHLMAQGFHTFCTFLAAEARSPPWPRPPQPAQQPAAQDAQVPAGAQRCGWLGAGAGGGATDGGGGDAAVSYIVVSPSFGLSAAEYVALLLHHMRYHAAFGVDRYLVYTEGPGTPDLAADPRVQALVREGRLRIVVWDELPHFFDVDDVGAYVRHPYAAQSLIYNHALVALWAEAAVAAVVDLDEYLMTARKTTLQRVMQDCSGDGEEGGGAPVVSLQVLRRVGYCTGCQPTAEGGGGGGGGDSGGGDDGGRRLRRTLLGSLLDRDQLRDSHEAERRIWLGGSANGGNSTVETGAAAGGAGGRGGGGGGGALVHPVALYGATTGDTEQKSVVRPHLVAFTNPHIAYPLPGLRAEAASSRCAYWMHVRSQLALRIRPGRFTDVREVKPEFRWPLGELAAGARGTGLGPAEGAAAGAGH